MSPSGLGVWAQVSIPGRPCTYTTQIYTIHTVRKRDRQRVKTEREGRQRQAMIRSIVRSAWISSCLTQESKEQCSQDSSEHPMTQCEKMLRY